MPESELIIDRMQTEYVVSREHPAPERVRGRLDETLGGRLPETLAAMLEACLDDSDESLWFIRELNLEVRLNAAWEHAQLAAVWAAEIARELLAELDAGTGENCIRFPHRAAYLARFAQELAEETAWSRWYYEPFDGLRVLPTATALRTALCDDPALSLLALRELSPAALVRTLRALTRSGAAQVLDSLAALEPVLDEFTCFQAVWAVWQAVEPLPLTADLEPVSALRLYVEARRDGSARGGLTFRSAALALLRLARRLRDEPAVERDALIEALVSGDRSALYRAAGVADAEILSPMLFCPAAWIQSVAQELRAQTANEPETEQPRRPQAESADRPPERVRRLTPFGGVFLLLPLLANLPLPEIAADWPGSEETDAEAILRLVLLAHCFGRERARSLFFDPLARELLGVAPSLSPEAVQEWAADLSPGRWKTFRKEIERWQEENTHPEELDARRARIREDRKYLTLPASLALVPLANRALSVAAQGLLRDFAWRLPGFSRSSLPYLFANFLDFAGSLETEETRRVVRLGRPPLSIVLHMTGMMRNTYRLPWLDENPFALFPDV